MLLFGTGTGRCGTITIANLLNLERSVCCVHEGLIRSGVEKKNQVLPYLTLQNVRAYHHPEEALQLFTDNRKSMPEIRTQLEKELLGDIAYNYAPFVHVIPKVFPEAKLIVMVRDGRDFVRSANGIDEADLAPAGWAEYGRPLTNLERFIELGRLRPIDSESPDSEWQSMSSLEKNAWLWAETNHLIFEGLSAWENKNVLHLRFEEFFSDPSNNYHEIRNFLSITDPLPAGIDNVLGHKLNKRDKYRLPRWQDWSKSDMHSFEKYAGPIMTQLGYF